MSKLMQILLAIVLISIQIESITAYCPAGSCNENGCNAVQCKIPVTGSCCCFIGFSGTTCNIGSYSK
jgi:hypothetical protein